MDMSHDHTDFEGLPSAFLTPKSTYFLHLYTISDQSTKVYSAVPLQKNFDFFKQKISIFFGHYEFLRFFFILAKFKQS
jgi:hypothetical protein